MIKLILISVLSASVFSACSSKSNNHTNHLTKSPSDNDKLNRPCENKSVGYRHLSVSELVVGQKAPDQPVFAQVDISLLANHTFIARYHEYVTKRIGESAVSVYEQNEKFIEGTWAQENNRLLLEGLGEGTGLFIDDRPAVNFNITKGLDTLLNRKVTFLIVVSNKPVSEKLNACK